MELALEKGVKPTTAEAIAEKAGISQRTFFNYFSAKEDAMLGLREPRMSQEVLDSVQSMRESTMLAYAAQILLQVVSNSFAQDDLSRTRELVQEHPELRERMKIHMLRCEGEMQKYLQAIDWQAYEQTGRLVIQTDVVEDHAEDPPPGPETEQVERARALLLMSAAVLRHINYGTGQSTEQTRAAIEQTVALFQEIVKETR